MANPIRATFNNPQFKVYPSKAVTDNLIQRGYMRLLAENLMYTDRDFDWDSNYVQTVLEHQELGTKLDFQFNPSQLTRSVTARTDTQLWINQSPSQLLQPGIGDMNFGWSMLFNREAEVTANEISDERRGALGLELHEPPLDQYLNSQAGQSPGGPPSSQTGRFFQGGTDEAAVMLGVLADIAVLDRITGQSISLEAYNYARRRFKLLVDQGLAYEDDDLHMAADATGNEARTLEEAADELAGGKSLGRDLLLNANRYNSAFLVPNPVRAVFSEHFMVDGYVNNVTVTFQKFSPEMVPTVATVDINMHAIYQGFTRQKSAFTQFIRLQHQLETPDSTSDGTGLTIAPDAPEHIQVYAELGGFTGSPLFGGFDHNSDHGDSKKAGLDLDAFNIVTTNPPDPLHHQTMQVQLGKGISFAPFSYLMDTALGQKISEEITGLIHTAGGGPPEDPVNGWTQSQFQDSIIGAKVWTGLQIRARLKTVETGQDGRNAMAALLGGNDTGITPYDEKGEVFFAKWPKAMRESLLAVGYDNMGKEPDVQVAAKDSFGVPGTSAGNSSGQFTGNGPYYTRSIPILAEDYIRGDDNKYGDQLYIGPITLLKPHSSSAFVAEPHNIEWRSATKSDTNGKRIDGHPFVYIHDDGDAIRWGQSDKADPITFQIAKGFWEYPGANNVNNSAPFRERLTINENDGGSGGSHEFKIEYQINLLYRVRLHDLHNEDNTISETGWLVVQPRKKAIKFVGEGKKGNLEQVEADNPTGWTGTNTTRLDSYDRNQGDWIESDHSSFVTGMIGAFKDIHFDGYDVEGGVYKWSDTLYHSVNSNPGGAYFQRSHSEHGVFKKSGDPS